MFRIREFEELHGIRTTLFNIYAEPRVIYNGNYDIRFTDTLRKEYSEMVDTLSNYGVAHVILSSEAVIYEGYRNTKTSDLIEEAYKLSWSKTKTKPYLHNITQLWVDGVYTSLLDPNTKLTTFDKALDEHKNNVPCLVCNEGVNVYKLPIHMIKIKGTVPEEPYLRDVDHIGHKWITICKHCNKIYIRDE